MRRGAGFNIEARRFPDVAGPHRPALYRASGYISLAATVVALLLVLYVGLVIYSASQIRPGSGGGTAIQQNVTSDGFELTAAVNFSNPGFLPIDQVRLSSVVDLPGHGGLLAQGSSPNVTAAPGTVAKVPLVMVIPFSAGSAGQMLLTHDAMLPAAVFANVSFARLFAVRIEIPTNISWGAPLADLNITPGTPTVTNGTEELPLELSFDDHAPFPVAGTAAVTVVGSGGAGCTATAAPFTLAAASHGSDSSASQLSAPAGCTFGAGDLLTGSFTSSAWSAPLPPETLP